MNKIFGTNRERGVKINQIYIGFLVLGFVIIVLSVFIPNCAYATTHDLATDSVWDIRIDGEQAGDKLGRYNLTYGDINYDGVDDLIITAISGYSGRTTINITYIIYSTLLDMFRATKIIDLAIASNYNLKIVAAESGDESDFYVATAVDLDNNGRKDIVLGQGYANNGVTQDTGAVYIIYDSLLSAYAGTGNLIDLSNSSKYNVKIVGTANGDYLGYSYSALFDYNGDGKRDLLLNADMASNTNGEYSGSAYIIYNDLLATFTGVGTLIDLTTAANYNIRIDGPTPNTWTESYVVGDHSDINSDGVDDVIIFAPLASNNELGYSGSAYVIYSTILSTYVGTGNVLDLADSTKYNLRFDGPRDNTVNGEASFGYSVTQAVDLNGNGLSDLILVDSSVDSNDRANSGSVYLIYDSLLSAHPGVGNNISLTMPANYTVRYDGSAAGGWLGEDIHAVDINNDGKPDLQIDAAGSPNLYILDNSLFASYTGTGHTVDMANEASYSTRYTHTGGYLVSPVVPADLNNDGKIDFIFADSYNDYNSRSDSGSVYVIYNFPHVITPTSRTISTDVPTIELKGTITSTSSATTIKKVEYNVGSDAISDYGWIACTADDGVFDSLNEAYTCSISSLSAGVHTIYLRAYDSDNSYTARSSYTAVSVTYAPIAITAFDFNGLTPAVLGTIDETGKTIALTVPYGTAVTALAPTITHTGASISPLSGVAGNFTTPQTYTVTAVDSSHQDYVVTVSVGAAPVVTNHGGGGMIIGWNNLPITPIGGFKIFVNSGASTTSNRIVTLNLNAGSDIKKIAISMTGDFADASQENYLQTRQWDLCSKFGGLIKNPTCPNGKYTIFAKFYTTSGIASPVATSSIILAYGTINAQTLPSVIFTKPLSFGMSLSDVRRLQTLLSTKPEIYPEGMITGYFGQLTKKAVQTFQLKYKVVSSKSDAGFGFVGPKTRAKLQEVFGNNN